MTLNRPDGEQKTLSSVDPDQPIVLNFNPFEKV